MINCVSLRSDPREPNNGLLADLFGKGWLRADALGLGLDVDEGLRVLSAAAGPSPGLYAVGPLTRGAVWEAVAVPDLRNQVALAAQTILNDVRCTQPEVSRRASV